MPDPCPPDPRLDAGLDRVDEVLARAAGVSSHARASTLRPVTAAAGFALAVVVVAAIASYLGASVAYDHASRHTDVRVAALERDLADRRAANQRGNAERDRQIGELRRMVCIFADHAQPRDVQVQDVRSRYGCDGGPYPPVAGMPSPRPS